MNAVLKSFDLTGRTVLITGSSADKLEAAAERLRGLGPGYFKTELTEALVNNAEFSVWLYQSRTCRA